MISDPRRALDALALLWSNRSGGNAAIRAAVVTAYGDDVRAVGADVPARHRAIVDRAAQRFGADVLAPLLQEHLELGVVLLTAFEACGGDVDGIMWAVGAYFDELAAERPGD